MRLQLGCDLELECGASTPLLVLVHPHASLQADLQGEETLHLEPDRTIELLTDQAGNPWCRLVAPPGRTRLRYAGCILRPDGPDPVVWSAPACPIHALPIETPTASSTPAPPATPLP